MPGDQTRSVAAWSSRSVQSLNAAGDLRTREQMRAELQRLPPHSPGHAALAARYDASLDELVERARTAWMRDSEEDRWTT